jgi:hypothetical protein
MAEKKDPRGSVNESQRPTAKQVAEMHTNSDVDMSAQSQHHTIGTGINQGASGAHKHDGSDSVRLGEGIIIAGSKGGNTALASAIAAMVQILGVKDETTP